ncbi:MAG TPA: TfoX/Sxy family protein [Longimicrobium sp.]|nr:TfoX/Sxy family protein [Longimicrobium sp.]
MAVRKEYRDYVLEQLGRVAPVTGKSMFGGVGVYSDGLFFALLAGEALYLKVDDTNRADFEAAGTGPFRPYGEDAPGMQYYELPPELLDDPDALRPWVDKALAVAAAARRRKKR